ncbi:DUF4244 domain-containing protein [Streptomyces triticagri]|uniref:DUF4244 domain-containing protein n=1 Tax=Streptomyces triticagri TaxID=2293568 RepID=A0A372MBS2_9ACTN|nr:DUF4244 domain-containing protein [Streptomyces triticagri]RFU88392.1 DUF4244 domain-containing protein [Streptomyces triticagri]
MRGVRRWRVRVLRVPRERRRHGLGDDGMITSEYALGTVAACGFAAVLYRVVTSDMVKGALEAVIGKGLDAQF